MSAARGWALLLTCEHASAALPARLRHALPGHEAESRTHRAYDIGALPVARALAGELRAPLIVGTVSRLVVDLNRSPTHPKVVGASFRQLPRREREALLAAYHTPHWEAVRAALDDLRGRRVLHLGVHSFTPVLVDEAGRRHVRTADLALLYDAARPEERAVAQRWLEALRQEAPGLRLRRNYPYRGRDDGLTTATRRRLPASRYLGFELEINQSLLGNKAPPALVEALVNGLRALGVTRG